MTPGEARGLMVRAVRALLLEMRGHVEVCCIERKALDFYIESQEEASEWQDVEFKAVDEGKGPWVVLCAQ